MHLIRFLLLSTLILSWPVSGTITIGDQSHLTWSTVSYSAVLPSPFHRITVTYQLRTNVEGELEIISLKININGTEIIVPESLLVGLTDPGPFQSTYSNPELTGSGMVENFSVIFAFGQRYSVTFEPCNDETYYRDIASFKISHDFRIEKEITTVTSDAECET